MMKLMLVALFVATAHAGNKCCNEACQSSSECSANMFCCPYKHVCMDVSTHDSLNGPHCDACCQAAPFSTQCCFDAQLGGQPDPRCHYLASKGYCNDPTAIGQSMKAGCKKSCGLCHSTVVEALVESSSPEVLLAVGEATITLNLDKLTNFDAVAHIAADNIAMTPVERVTFAGDIKASVDLFKGQLSMVDSGTSSATVDCASSPYARYMPQCTNPVMKALSELKKEGAGELFIDAETGKMGLKGHGSGEGAGGAGYATTFCAIVHLPVKSYPPPSMLRQKLNAQMLARAQAQLNKFPHTEAGGVATFSPPASTFSKSNGYPYGTDSWKMHTDGGDPIEFSFERFRPEHARHSAGWKEPYAADGETRTDEPYVADGGASITFSSWTSPASAVATFSSCPAEGTTTDIHAHPEAKRSLAALNVVVSQLRHNDDFAWLPENPASFFIEEVEKQREEVAPEEVAEESQDSQLSPVVASFLAGVLGGGVVLAFFLVAQKRHRQEEYTALNA